MHEASTSRSINRLARPSSLRRAMTTAFAGNVFYTACQGVMTIAIARLGPPDLLGLFGLGIAVAAPVVELAGLQLQVVESVDTKQKNSFHVYLRLQNCMSILAFIVVAFIALLGPYRGEAVWAILACALSKIVEASSLVCHGKMQQTENVEKIAVSLIYRGLGGLLGMIVGIALTGSVVWGIVGLTLAWLIVLLQFDWPQANALEVQTDRRPGTDVVNLANIAWLALPLGLFVGLNSLLVSAPRFFVESHLGTRELGIFSAISYLGLAARAFYTSFLNAVLARLADHHQNGQWRQFVLIVGKAFLIVVMLGATGCAFAAIAGKYILTLFGQEYVAAHPVLIPLTAAMALKTLWMLFVSSLYAMNRFRLILCLQAIGGLFLLWLLMKWVEPFGLSGAAWAIFLSSAFDVMLFAIVSIGLLLFDSRRQASWKFGLDPVQTQEPK